MSEGAAEVNVEVNTPEPPQETEAETPAVVVVESGDDPAPGNSDALVEIAGRVGALEAMLAAMREDVEEVEEVAGNAEREAEFAADIALEAPAVAADVAEETAEETVEEIEDEPPAKVHWMHRPMREWFGGSN